jgi:hypothetical protein
MNMTLPALLRLANAPRSRLVLAVALGALTVAFGVGLMARAGYLISRAAERPAVLSLMVAIVGVRFFGLGRPVIRYPERLVSHDLARRVLGRVRTRRDPFDEGAPTSVARPPRRSLREGRSAHRRRRPRRIRVPSGCPAGPGQAGVRSNTVRVLALSLTCQRRLRLGRLGRCCGVVVSSDLDCEEENDDQVDQ